MCCYFFRLPLIRSRSCAGLPSRRFFVGLEEGIGILITCRVAHRNVVMPCFEPCDDLFRGLSIRLPAFGVQLSEDLIETGQSDLCTIGKPQRAPANCRRFLIPSSGSADDLKKRHKLTSLVLPVFSLRNRIVCSDLGRVSRTGHVRRI